MKEVFYVLASLLQLGVLVYVFYLGFKGLQYVFSNRTKEKYITKNVKREYRKKTLISAVSLATLMIIKYFTN